MMSKLQSPLVAALLAVVLSVATGLYVIRSAAMPIIEKIKAERSEHPAEGAGENIVEVKARGWDFWTIEIDNLASELREERARQKKQADLLDQRASRMASEERQLAKARAEIEAVRKEISDKVIELSTDETKNLRALAQTYTSLTPKAVVAIFREMDDMTAVKILSLMKPDTVGPIFEEMSKTAGTDGPLAKRAAVLSEKLRLLKGAKVAG